MNPPSDPGFEVPISGAIRELLIRLHDMAAVSGRRDEFLDALRSISARLRSDPVTFGEEVFDLPELQLTVKVAVVLPVAVEFAVYPARHLVFIRDFRYYIGTEDTHKASGRPWFRCRTAWEGRRDGLGRPSYEYAF